MSVALRVTMVSMGGGTAKRGRAVDNLSAFDAGKVGIATSVIRRSSDRRWRVSGPAWEPQLPRGGHSLTSTVAGQHGTESPQSRSLRALEVRSSRSLAATNPPVTNRRHGRHRRLPQRHRPDVRQPSLKRQDPIQLLPHPLSVPLASERDVVALARLRCGSIRREVGALSRELCVVPAVDPADVCEVSAD